MENPALADNLAATKMSPRERIINAIHHRPVDRIPVDLGGTVLTGAHATVVARLRQALGLDKPGTPVKVIEPFQMLGEIAHDLREVLEIDVVAVLWPKNFFGIENRDWKPWKYWDGTDLLVPGLLNTDPEPNGDILVYPEGDRSVPPGARMPNRGFYFDAIVRQPPIDEAKLNPADNTEEFGPVSEEDLNVYAEQVSELYAGTDLGIATGFPGTGFGTISLVPAPWMKHPKGIRDIEEWYISTLTRKDYVLEVFSRQADIAIENLERIYQAIGNKVHVVVLDSTDLGTQTSQFCSAETYRELYQPFHKRLNDWVHAHTQWKTMKHCCGAVEPFIEDFIAAGFDILNPVQCSAAGMDPHHLTDRYGGKIVFWGGGVDTQSTLPFGTPDQVRDQVRERARIFGQSPGFVFAAVHNIQALTPAENILAMFEVLGRSVRQ